MEASFAGAAPGSALAGLHFHAGHLEAMGAALATSLLDYWDPEQVCVWGGGRWRTAGGQRGQG